jgi:N-acetylmuramoyl-L-alanine amidase
MNEVMGLKFVCRYIPIYLLVLLLGISMAQLGSRGVTVMSEAAPLGERQCVIIDAGHGGVDGGATSCTGVPESQINLEIALKLQDLCHLLGLDTKMIRTEDISVYTEGESIASKKVSDLKNRLRMINETQNAIVISIHQNYFTDGRYSGAQVFYPRNETSQRLASQLQTGFANLDSNRSPKEAKGIYLLEHMKRPGVLVECGFLSNPREEALLRDQTYQKKLCCVIASCVSRFLNT